MQQSSGPFVVSQEDVQGSLVYLPVTPEIGNTAQLQMNRMIIFAKVSGVGRRRWGMDGIGMEVFHKTK